MADLTLLILSLVYQQYYEMQRLYKMFSITVLDQDLPNNMIHQVAIKSLPQEWLWCETWCDNDTKKYAKTIDLVSYQSYRKLFLF